MNKTHTIMLVGAGQLGSRHLQALASVRSPLEIIVIDPSASSLNQAKIRFDEVKKNEKKISFFSKIPKEIQKIDIAIIATNSDCRVDVVEELLSKTHSKYLILEKLLANKESDLKKLTVLLSKNETEAWVNCSMRTMTFYAELAKTKKNNIIFTVTGNDFGLITNSIHYIDYVSLLTGKLHFSLDTSLLDKKIKESKRRNFKECTGTLIAKFGDGSLLSMTSYNNGELPLVINITSKESRYVIRESEGLANISTAKEGWRWREQEISIPYQSEMTTQVIEKLLSNEGCALSPALDNIKLQEQLMTPMTNFLKEVEKNSSQEFPFT